MRFLGIVTFALMMAMLPGGAFAQDIRVERVHFDAGTSGATIKGSLKGYEIADYLLGANAGQRMTIDFKTDNPSAYFNLLPADSETAIHIGSVAGNHFSDALPANGDYRIRVYLMRNAARRNEAANYSFSVSIGGATAQMPEEQDPDFADGLSGGPDYWEVSNVASNDTLNVRAGPGTGNRVIGELANGERVRNLGCRMTNGSRWCRIEAGADQKFTGWVSGRYLREAVGLPSDGDMSASASGAVPCSTAAGQPTFNCPFRVTRGGNGNASVWIALPDGKERFIEFRAGEPVNTDPGLDLSFEKLSDLYLIRIAGFERYEIPEALVFGG